MGVSAEKSKVMTNSMNNISADISMNGPKLEEVAISSTWEQPCASMAPAQQTSAFRITSAMAAMARLNRIRQCNTISFESKFKM